MTLQIVKATKTKSLLRGAIFGPAGAGKTLTSLMIAQGFIGHLPGKRIGVIDTERRSQKYAGYHPILKREFDFDRIDIAGEPTLENYIGALGAFAATGEHGFVIIDSSTQAWEILKDEVSKIAKARYKGNEWAAWSEGTPIQRKFIDTLILYPLHIIWTMRSATEWKTNEKNQPMRIGLKPEQGKGIEYEADFLLEMTTENICTVLKDTSGKFQGRIIERPDDKFGSEMWTWLNEGAEAPPMPIPVQPEPKDVAAARALRAATTMDELAQAWKALPDSVRPLVVAVKDEMKAQLSKPAPAAETRPEEAPKEDPKETPQSETLFGPRGDLAPAQDASATIRAQEILVALKRTRSRRGIDMIVKDIARMRDAGEVTEEGVSAMYAAVIEHANNQNIPMTQEDIHAVA